MMKTMKSVVLALAVVSVLGVWGCSSSPSDEEMKQLSDLKAEVNALQKQVNDKQAEKSALEKANADRNGKLQQCQADQQAVKTALGK